MTKSRCCDHFHVIVLLSLSSLSVVLLAGQSSASESSLDVPQDPTTLFDSSESPTKDTGSGEETGNDLTSPDVGPVPQRRRSSFRADLGKRFSVDWSRLEGKRPSKTSFFRSDLGKRRWNLESPMGPGFEDDGEQLVEMRYETMGAKGGSVRRKRFVVDELERQMEDGGPGRWEDVEKRPRSSFRADLGKRFENEHGYGEQDHEDDNEDEVEEGGAYPKRARYAFRGDLGKRSPELWDVDDKRRYAFRGDLGRKRSLTLESRNTRLPLSYSSFDGEERLQKLVDSAKGSGSDLDYDGGLEKRRFRSDLG